jgi:hypothetical protein
MRNYFNNQTKSDKRGGDKMKGKITATRLFVSLALALSMVCLFAAPVMADTSQPITITATPSFIGCTNTPGTWTLNGIDGSGLIAVDTIYYSNPIGASGDVTAPGATAGVVVDAECYFSLTNTSTVTTDMFIDIGNFTGGSAIMTNSDDGSNGATSFGAYSYCTGTVWANKVLCKVSSDTATKEDLAPTTNIKWGAQIETRTNAWTGGTSSTATMTVRLAAA